MIKTATPNTKELRQFGLIMGIAMVAVFAGLLPWIWDFTSPRWPWLIAIPLWSCALIAPFLLAPVYRIWMKIGHVLGWLNTRLIMGLVFCVFIIPMALVLRLFSGTQIQRTQKSQASSFRQTSSPREPDHFKRLF